MCPAVQPDVTAERTLQKFPHHRMSTEDTLSEDTALATCIYLFMPSKSQLPPSCYWVILGGGIRGGREGPQGPPKPAPTAVTAPP